MKLALSICIGVILIILFFVTPSKLNSIVNIFLFLCLEFLISTFYSLLYINLGIWKISQQAIDYLTFQTYELIILPFSFLIFINYFLMMKSNTKRSALILFFLFMLLMAEQFFIHFEILNRQKGILPSVVGYTLVFIISLLLIKIFQHLLRKEGIYS
jgi:hypothetical protein